jgi:o-succinylbenzoate---CoA ligase
MLATWIGSHAARLPDAPALIVADKPVRYAELAARIDADAGSLLTQGFVPGATLAVLSRSSLVHARLAWSVSRLNGTLLPLNPAWPEARIDAMLEQAEADGVLRDEEVASAGRLRQFELPGAVGEGVALPPLALDRRRITLVIATSGSSGEPKGVMLGNANLEAAVLAARERMPLVPGDVWLACLSLYHIGGQSILYRCAEAGAAVLLEEGFEPGRVRDAIVRHGVTHISLVPAMLARLMELGPPPQGLKYALVGGAPLSAALARRADESGWPLCVSYGMSEATSQVATLCPLSAQWNEGMAGPPAPRG